MISDERGNVIVATQSLETFTLPNGTKQPVPHVIVIPPEAIGSRMALYGLTTPAAAFEAILREHGARISPAITLPKPPATRPALGGDRTDVAISYGASSSSQRDAELQAHAVTITAAKDRRWNDPRYVAIRTGKA